MKLFVNYSVKIKDRCRMKNKLVLLILLFISNIYADDIYFKNGKMVLNCKVVSQNDSCLYVRINKDNKAYVTSFDKNTIYMIKKAPIDENSKTKIIKTNEAQKRYTSKLKLNKNLVLSLGMFALSYDYFQEASKYNDALELLEDINKEYGEDVYETKDLKEERDRKKIVAFICLGTGIINTFLSLESIELKPEKQGVSLSYEF